MADAPSDPHGRVGLDAAVACVLAATALGLIGSGFVLALTMAGPTADPMSFLDRLQLAVQPSTSAFYMFALAAVVSALGGRPQGSGVRALVVFAGLVTAASLATGTILPFFEQQGSLFIRTYQRLTVAHNALFLVATLVLVLWVVRGGAENEQPLAGDEDPVIVDLEE